MPRLAIPPSRAVADLLAARRKALGLTLRDVEKQTGELGRVIPFTTLAKIEGGVVDPGIHRLTALLRLYNLPFQTAGDLAQVEAQAGVVPRERDPAKLRARGEAAWQEGKTGEALACLLALRRVTAEIPALTPVHQESVLAFAVIAGKLGKHHLSRLMLDELLLQRPDRALLVGIMVQQASSWNALGAPDSALAYLGGAETHLRRDSHRERGWILHQRASIQIGLQEFASAASNLAKARRAFRTAGRPYDEGLTLCAIARLYVEQQDVTKALRAARRAREFASRHRFDRVRMLATIQLARAYLVGQVSEPALVILRAMLSESVAADDNVGRFHAHFYLWKAYAALGARSRAELELREAVFYLRSVDEASQEAIELWGLLGSSKTGRTLR